MTEKLKVLQLICPTGFYGAERWILALAKNLKDDQVQCDLAVTVEPGFDEPEISKHYKELGKKVHEVAMSGRFDLSVILRLRSIIREGGYQIIHTHGYKSDILGLVAARLSGIRALVTPHGFENADDWKLRLYIGLGNQFLKFFDVVAPLSEQLCKDMDEIGVSSAKVRYIQNGVDLDEVERQRVRTDNTYLNNKTKKRIGFIGQMISRKNIHGLLDIFEILAAKHSNLELKLLGDGEMRAELEQYSIGLASRENIEFLGFCDNRLEWLQSFDLFVMTSTLEGIPRCLMEAMAMGIPVAAFDISGIDQLVEHESTGLLAKPGDVNGLVRCWEKLLYDRALAAQIADNAIQNIQDNFSGSAMAKQYYSLYCEMHGLSPI